MAIPQYPFGDYYITLKELVQQFQRIGEAATLELANHYITVYGYAPRWLDLAVLQVLKPHAAPGTERWA